MLINIKSIDGLQEAITFDKNVSGEQALVRNRYPVRFLLFNDFSLFKEGITRLCQNNMELKRIESELPFDDGWITRMDMRVLIEDLVRNSGIDIIVSPFSEVIRFYDDAEFISFFKEVSMIEANPEYLGKRVYLPIIGLEHRLGKFKNAIEGALIWEMLINNPIQHTIYVTQDYNIPLPEDITHIKTSKEWLKLWTGSFPKKQILCSSSPILNYYKNSQPDTVFNLEPISTEYDFLIKIFKLQSSIPYKECDNEYWKELLDRFQEIKLSNFNLDKFSLNHFNIVQFKPKDFLRLWFANHDGFSRWLLVRNFEAHTIAYDSYLGSVLSHLSDFSDNSLISHICIDIFQPEINSFFIGQRDELLKFIHREKIAIPENIDESIKSLINELLVDNISTAVKLFAGNFDFEEEILLKLFTEEKITIDQLQSASPLIYQYLKETPKLNLDEKQKWIYEYIDVYKHAKIINQYTPDISRLISIVNENEHSFYDWYTSIPTPRSVLSSAGEVDKYYWFDGLGIEWISFIYEIIKKYSHLSFSQFEITKTNLPSTTEINRFPDFDKKDGLDTFIHKYYYKYPDTIIEEIKIVQSVIEEIIGKIQNQTIAIVSDHGLTSLSRLVESKKYQIDDEHEGRCALAKAKMNKSCEDYIIYQHPDAKYVVALKHASLGVKPRREAHGGCTPEEVLVPTIVITDKIKKDKKVRAESTEIKKSGADKPGDIGFEEVDLF